MDLEQEIDATKRQLNELNRVQSHVDSLDHKRKKLEKLQLKLQEKVEKEFEEYKDEKQRNEQAIRSLFLLPDDEKLEKEKQEYFEAVLDLRKVDKEIELIQFESNVLTEKLVQKEELMRKLMDLVKVRAAQKVKALRENQTYEALEQDEEMQKGIIYLLEGIRTKGQENMVRIDETLAALHQIELYGLTKKKDRYMPERILRELERIENHLAHIQVNFSKLEPECFAYNTFAKENKTSVPDWEKYLAPMRNFSEDFQLKADLQLLKKGFLQSRKWLIKLKLHLDKLTKESSFLIEEHQQVKKTIERDKAALAESL
ncbi:MAG: hypothetical protein KTR30_09590 [Saprospiraceae bacterium]|nr:hypothetical protein [Saprospiraceae bacterium]